MKSPQLRAKCSPQKRGLTRGLMILLALVFAVAALGAGEAPAKNAAGCLNGTVAVDPTGRSEGYSAVLYDSTNGLPTSEANAIAQTSEGFLWIGSYSGLIRYDGNTFVRLDSTTGIASVISLYADSRERLWIGTNDAGIAVMERGEFRRWGEAEGLQSLHVGAIVEDDDGLIYAGTTMGVAVIGPEMDLRLLEDPRLRDAYIESMRAGNDGLIYGVTSSSDLFTLRDGELVSFFSHEDYDLKGVVYVLPDPQQAGAVYLATDGSTVYHGSLENGLRQDDSWDISPLSNPSCLEVIDGQLWICARNGIGSLGEAGFTPLDHLPMNNSVGHVMTDYQGNLWFTSTRQGVMKIVPNQFSDLFERYGLAPTVVNSTCLGDGKLFLGTDTGLMVLDENGLVDAVPLTRAVTASGEDLGATDLLQLLDGCRIRSIIRDSLDRLWFSTWQGCGLVRYDRGRVTTFTDADGLLSGRIRVACERQDGSMLVVNTGGVSVIEGDQVTKSYGKEAGVVNAESLSVAEGFHDDIVLGSSGGGIYVISEAGTKNITIQDGLSSQIIMRVKRDDRRRLFWIVTSNSLAVMTEDYQVTTIREFPYSNNYDLVENSQGDLWVLASNGIYVVPAEEVLANGTILPVYYGRSSGLPGIATGNSYSELTDRGDLYIASSSGVVKVNIEASFENVSDLKAAVPYIDVDGQRLYPDAAGGFTIPSSAHKLTVSSFVFTYSLADPQVSYQLEGFEEENSPLRRSELVPVDYTNLRGGSYRFVIRLRDAMGRGGKETAVTIVKEKAFYEQLWFYLVAGALLLALLGFGVRYYVRRKTRALERKQQETMTFVTEVTEAFAKVIDMKDKYTNGHSTRVAKYTAMLAQELGCDQETVERYYRIALLHDIGKIGVPPEVLNKPGKLTEEEFETIKSHASEGYETLKDISIMPELAIGAQAHHERPDGRGYPNHLQGDQIPRVAQIIAVADCFDAMYSNRPYRERMNFDKVVSIIREVSGTQLATDVVDAFLRLVEKGELRDPEDTGGGSMENIENIHQDGDQAPKE